MTGKDVRHVELHGSRLAAEVLDGVALPFFFTQVVQSGVEWGLDGRFESEAIDQFQISIGIWFL